MFARNYWTEVTVGGRTQIAHLACTVRDPEEMIAKFAEAGIDLHKLATELQREATEAFVKDWNEMLVSITSKSAAFNAAGFQTTKMNRFHRNDATVDTLGYSRVIRLLNFQALEA